MFNMALHYWAAMLLEEEGARKSNFTLLCVPIAKPMPHPQRHRGLQVNHIQIVNLYSNISVDQFDSLSLVVSW